MPEPIPRGGLENKSSQRIGRRDFLRLFGATFVSAALAGCGNQPEPTQTTIKIGPEKTPTPTPVEIKQVKIGNEVREWSDVVDISAPFPNNPRINSLNSAHVSTIKENAPQIKTKAYFNTQPLQMIWSEIGSQKQNFNGTVIDEQKLIITYYEKATNTNNADYAIWTTKNNPSNPQLISRDLVLAELAPKSSGNFVEVPSNPFISISYDKSKPTIPISMIIKEGPNDNVGREFSISQTANSSSLTNFAFVGPFGAGLVEKIIIPATPTPSPTIESTKTATATATSTATRTSTATSTATSTVVPPTATEAATRTPVPTSEQFTPQQVEQKVREKYNFEKSTTAFGDYINITTGGTNGLNPDEANTVKSILDNLYGWASKNSPELIDIIKSSHTRYIITYHSEKTPTGAITNPNFLSSKEGIQGIALSNLFFTFENRGPENALLGKQLEVLLHEFARNYNTVNGSLKLGYYSDTADLAKESELRTLARPSVDTANQQSMDWAYQGALNSSRGN